MYQHISSYIYIYHHLSYFIIFLHSTLNLSRYHQRKTRLPELSMNFIKCMYSGIFAQMKPTTQKLHFINNFLAPLENRLAKPGPNQVSEGTMKNGDASRLHSLSLCGSFRTYAGMGSWCSKHPVASTKWRPQCTVRQSTAIWVNAFFSECAGPVMAKIGSSLTVHSLNGMWGKISSPWMLLCFNLQNHFVSNIFRFNSGLSSPQMAAFKI